MHTRYQFVTVDGVKLFYREAGPVEAPVILLLHGFPSSSIQFRYLLSELSDRWRLIAPDLPGFGFSEVPNFRLYEYSFPNIGVTLHHFLTRLEVNPHVVYLHDYGAQVGFHMLTSGKIAPEAIVIQNSEAHYAEGRTSAWKNAETFWKEPSMANEEKLRNAFLNSDGIRNEFLEDLPQELVERIDPAIIHLAIEHFKIPAVVDAMIALHHDYKNNVAHYTSVQEYFQQRQLPSLILWGQRDQYYKSEQAYAFSADLPTAQIELLDGGHWLLETHPQEVAVLMRDFLIRLGAKALNK